MVAECIQCIPTRVWSGGTSPDLERHLILRPGDIHSDLSFCDAFPDAQDQRVVRATTVQDAVGQEPAGTLGIDPLAIGWVNWSFLEVRVILVCTGGDENRIVRKERGRRTFMSIHLNARPGKSGCLQRLTDVGKIMGEPAKPNLSG